MPVRVKRLFIVKGFVEAATATRLIESQRGIKTLFALSFGSTYPWVRSRLSWLLENWMPEFQNPWRHELIGVAHHCLKVFGVSHSFTCAEVPVPVGSLMTPVARDTLRLHYIMTLAARQLPVVGPMPRRAEIPLAEPRGGLPR